MVWELIVGVSRSLTCGCPGFVKLAADGPKDGKTC